MGTPRIPPLAVEDRDEEAGALLDGLGRAGEMNIFTTLVRHPRLFRRWIAFGGVLLSGELPARDRELLILRTAHRCGADYEWTHHRAIAERAGLDGAEIERVAEGPDGDWRERDAALLRAADELHDEQRIADATWDTLASGYDQRQLIEIPMVVGQYHLVAFLLRSLGIELEDGEAGA